MNTISTKLFNNCYRKNPIKKMKIEYKKMAIEKNQRTLSELTLVPNWTA